MKYYFGVLSLAIAFTACQNNSNKSDQEDKSTTNDSTKTASHELDNGHYCFIHTEGQENQDSTTVHFVIDNDHVTGDMAWIPFEKDQRKGTLNGTIEEDHITAVWTYMQEGMTDTLELHFQLPSTGMLTQKPTKTNPENQREETDQTADYTIAFSKTDCK